MAQEAAAAEIAGILRKREVAGGRKSNFCRVRKCFVGAQNYFVGIQSYFAGAQSYFVGAQNYFVGAQSYFAGAQNYFVKAQNQFVESMKLAAASPMWFFRHQAVAYAFLSSLERLRLMTTPGARPHR